MASCSLQCCCLLEAPEKVLTGPGVGAGARRYLGVARPSMMFLWLQQWAKENSQPVPSFATFCRAVRECRGWLKFRKNAGEHAVCDTCWLLGCSAGSVHVLPIAVSVHTCPAYRPATSGASSKGSGSISLRLRGSSSWAAHNAEHQS